MRLSAIPPLLGLAALLGGCTVVQPVAPVAAIPAAATSAPYCREYTATGLVGGQPQRTVGTACLDSAGHWRIVSGNDAAQRAGAAAPPAVAYAYPYPYPYPYPSYSYLAPYPDPFWWGPRLSLGFGFRFGHHHHHGGHHHWH